MNTTSLYAIMLPNGSYYPRNACLRSAKFFSAVSIAKGIITRVKNKRDRGGTYWFGLPDASIVKVDLALDDSWSL